MLRLFKPSVGSGSLFLELFPPADPRHSAATGRGIARPNPEPLAGIISNSVFKGVSRSTSHKRSNDGTRDNPGLGTQHTPSKHPKIRKFDHFAIRSSVSVCFVAVSVSDSVRMVQMPFLVARQGYGNLESSSFMFSNSHNGSDYSSTNLKIHRELLKKSQEVGSLTCCRRFQFDLDALKHPP